MYKKVKDAFIHTKMFLIIDTLRKYIDDNVEPELFAYCIFLF